MLVGTMLRRAKLEDSYDAIVVGSGIGGLTTAVCLAKSGRKVLVLERHYTAGGFTHTFTRKGFEWDVGVHYIGDAHRKGSSIRRIFDYVSDGKLEWAEMPEIYDRVVIDGDTYDFRAGKSAFREQLCGYFSKERDAIDRYLALVTKVVQASMPFFVERTLPPVLSQFLYRPLSVRFLQFARQSTLQVLSQLTQNRRLIAVLTAQWGDYALPPAQSSFAIHALVVRHYLSGACYPVGGAGSIARTIAQVLEQHCAQLVTGAEVASIMVEDRRAVGVRLSVGRELRANLVVSAVGARNTFLNLLPDGVDGKTTYRQNLSAVSPSMAHLGLYLGLEGSASELDLPRHNLWLHASENYDERLQDFVMRPNVDFPFVYISFPSAKDPAWAAKYPRKSTIEMVVPAPFKWFSPWQGSKWHKRGPEYLAYKQQATDKLLELLHAQLPQIRGKVRHAELSTPLSTAHFCNYQHGEIYGLNHDVSRFEQRWLRPETAIKNLFLTGQDILACGVGGALSSGVLAAIRILGPLKARELIAMLIPHRL